MRNTYVLIGGKVPEAMQGTLSFENAACWGNEASQRWGQFSYCAHTWLNPCRHLPVCARARAHTHTHTHTNAPVDVQDDVYTLIPTPPPLHTRIQYLVICMNGLI